MKALILAIVLICVVGTSPAQNPGDKVEVFDPIEKNWFKSTILKSETSRWFIHYEGYDPKWDVWVDASRIRGIGENKDSPVFHLIGSSEDLYKYYVADEVVASYFTQDSISFTSSKGDAYAFKKLPGNRFMDGNQKIYESKLYAYWLDNNSFLLSRSNSKISYYHRDEKKGTELLNNKMVARDADSLKAQVGRVEERQWAAEKNQLKQQQFNTVTNYLRNYRSKRTDPELVKAVTAWWNGTGKVVNPLLKVYLCSPGYAINRNEFGVVQNKQICVLYIYKWGATGKCYVAWRNFGYESLGGGAWDNQLRDWAPSDVVFNMDKEKLDAGKAYELDCNVVKP